MIDSKKIVGVCHLFTMMMENLYGIITTENTLYDNLYVLSFVGLPISWVLCKDECYVSYCMKK